MDTEGSILLEIDGPGVSPSTLRPRQALELATSYLDLLYKLAVEEGRTLDFHGIEVIDKCAAFRFGTTSISDAEEVADAVSRMTAGQEEPPARLARPTERLRAAIRALPDDQQATVLVAKRSFRLSVVQDQPRFPADSIIEVRGIIVRAGGLTLPTARFESRAEPRGFTLRLADRERAKDIASHLYATVDVVAKVKRDEEGMISSGELLEYFVVSDESPLDAWDRWYRENASEWDAVNDIEKELGRD